eukprot:scaffold7033_cov257-Pinguiococcus_pyrenoidosus.AAC.28
MDDASASARVKGFLSVSWATIPAMCAEKLKVRPSPSRLTLQQLVGHRPSTFGRPVDRNLQEGGGDAVRGLQTDASRQSHRMATFGASICVVIVVVLLRGEGGRSLVLPQLHADVRTEGRPEPIENLQRNQQRKHGGVMRAHEKQLALVLRHFLWGKRRPRKQAEQRGVASGAAAAYLKHLSDEVAETGPCRSDLVVGVVAHQRRHLLRA